MQDVHRISPGKKTRGSGPRSGMALLITLLAMALMTIIVVAFLGTMIWEQTASRRDYDNQRARAMATLGMNTAVAQLRSALGVWDNPFVNFTNSATASNYYYWSASPGILTRWAYTNVAPLTNYPLFSIDPNGATNLVNLNAEEADGTYPIIGGANPPGISVYWANIMANPTLAPSASNPIVGRYAFWVDDENAKININTADGTLKYTTNSLGLGTPSEVSLQVLQQGGSPLSAAEAANMVYIARTTGFNSIREILRTPGSTPDLYTNNVFNLTAWGRCPELNIWGEPKINLISVSTPLLTAQSAIAHGILETNNITGQALTEIYPTPSQLSPLRTVYPGSGLVINSTNAWQPLAVSSWYMFDGDINDGHGFQGDGESWLTTLIQGHLGGTNSVGMPITWPLFPGANGAGFLGKYSLRQLDSIGAEITDEVGKALVPEAYPVGSAVQPYTYSVPLIATGRLSHQEAFGLGRSAKINEIYISAATYGGVIGTATYVAPYINMSIYMETYLPAGFAGVDLLNVKPATGLPPATGSGGGYIWGSITPNYESPEIINMVDLGTNLVGSGYLPTGFSPIARTNYATTGGTANNYWQDSVLQNDQGIDFLGNPNSDADPDQQRAAVYHSYLTNNPVYTSSGKYPGSGPSANTNTPMLEMGDPSYSGSSGVNPWYPGQYRTVVNAAASANFDMTNANAGTTLHISGGLIVTGAPASRSGDPDPTPLESGTIGTLYTATNALGVSSSYGGADDYSPPSSATNNNGPFWPAGNYAPFNPAQTTYPSNSAETARARIVNGSIPVVFSLAVPAASSSGLATGNAITYDVSVADPLVNKFPGDWIPSTNTAPTMGGTGGAPPAPASMSSTLSGGYTVYYNGQNSLATGPTANSPYYDADSFWMPTLDPKIPRSARFPNIGYLNYLRTGVIPDDETVAIGQQHGTPYRCLNFNADSDASQMGATNSYRSSGYYYPDWAILDLFTIPSTLTPYGGPYGYYKYASGTNAGTATWSAGAILNGNPTNMYYYGTWGGSTPGRINPNGAVVYTTNANVPTPGISRLLPIEALMTNIMVNQTIPNGSGTTPPPQLTNAPTFTGGATVATSSIATAIATYLTTNTYGIGGSAAPLRQPAEICNLLAGYTAISSNPGGDSQHNNPTRNDLVRQIVGNLTTQSNVFSIWVEGQTITKSKLNINSGIYESGDQITGSVRYHFVIERYLQPGASGVYGNTQVPTPHFSTSGTNAYAANADKTNALGDVDGIAGTYDDPADSAYHPINPRYFYRVIYAEEIRD